jgi:glycerophosphoryl diester phosphodiesterase
VRRIGHRGAKGHVPENTIASFQKAIDLGCDEIETDVWLVQGRLLISHDRPASAVGLLTLEETLEFCEGRVGLNIEVKSGGSEAHAFETGATVARLLRTRASQDVYVSSFWYASLAAAQKLAPDVRRAFVFGAAPVNDAVFAQAGPLGLWALHPEHHYVTPERVIAAHDRGLLLHTWTVNDPTDIARLAEWGVDGIMSDFPERVPKLAR